MPFEIPLCEPYLPAGGREWEYVKQALDSGCLMAGPFVSRLEEAFADRLGRRYAIACASGTAALHIALLVAGVGPGDDVLCPTLTFIATANAIRYCGARPVLVDVEARYWQIDPDLAASRRAKGLIPVGLLGHPWMILLAEDEPDPWEVVIADATEALGARQCTDENAGGDIDCYSLNANKVISGAGGGMLVTDNADWARQARYLINQARDEGPEFDHGDVGYNYRLSNVQAAIALAQFERLDEHLAAKKRIAARYAEALGDLPGLTLMPKAPWAEPAYWLYTILVEGGSRWLLHDLDARGIETRPIFRPIHLQPPYADCPRIGGEVAEAIWREAISLPSSVGLTEAQQDRVIGAIRRFMEGKG